MVRYDVHFSGNVQGVGFRATAERLASNHPVTGYVRNLPDGRVRLVAEGDEDRVRAFVDEVRRAMSGHIEDEDVQVGRVTDELGDFRIRH